MYILCVYVPEGYEEKVKEACFNAGGGSFGDYDRCCWQTLGRGQFRPLQGSRPFMGNEGNLEVVQEWRIEMICDDGVIADVVRALKESHPYETPAFHLIPAMSETPCAGQKEKV